MGKQQRD